MCNNCNGCFRGLLNLFNNNGGSSCGCSRCGNGNNGRPSGCGCSSNRSGNNGNFLSLFNIFNGIGGNFDSYYANQYQLDSGFGRSSNNSGCGCGCSGRSVPNNNNCGCYDAYYAMQYGLTNNGCGCSNWYNLNVRSGCGCSSGNSGCGCSNNSGCGCSSNRTINSGFTWNWWGNGIWNN